MSEQPPQDPGMQVEFTDVLTAVHDEYQNQIRGLVDRLSVQSAAVKKYQAENGQLIQNINMLNGEVATLRTAAGEKSDPAPRGTRKVRDVPQA